MNNGRFCHLCGKTNNPVFSFPKKNDKRREEWLQFCKIPSAAHISVPFLCQNHFDQKFILKKPKRTILHGHAVPTITIEPSSSNDVEGEEKSSKKRSLKYCCICGPTYCHLHKFPKDEALRSEWLCILDMREEQRKDLRLCSKHFQIDCIRNTPYGRETLKYFAKPVSLESNTNTRSDFTASTTYVASSASESLLPESRHDSIVAATHSTASISQKTILNQTSLEKVRGALQQMATSQKVEVESSEVILMEGESLPHISRETNTAACDVMGNAAVNNLYPILSNDVDLAEFVECTYDVDVSSISPEINSSGSALSIFTERASTMNHLEANKRKTSEEIRTPTIQNTPVRRSIRYLGDIDTPSLDSPVTRRKCLCVIRNHRRTAGKKIYHLTQENNRLKAKVKKLKSILSELKKKNVITEDAATTLLVL